MSESSPGLDAPISSEPLRAEAVKAARNSVMLIAAMGASWAIGLVGRLIVPRYLGPEMFGAFQFADYFSASFFVITIFGIDTYIRKEVSVRPAHASDFFGGLMVMRVGASAVALALMLIVLAITGKPRYVLDLALIFALNQVLIVLNTSYQSLLNAVGHVKGLSALSVAIKCQWAVSVVIAAWFGLGAQAFAWALVISEVVKAAGLTWLVREHVGMRFHVDMAATRLAVVSSLPFWVVGLTGTLYNTADVSLMAFRASDIEVGWYGAATALVNIALVLAPIIHNVFLPMSSRAATRSDDELNTVVRRWLEGLVSLVTPLALFGALGAEFAIVTIFGTNFEPGARSFRILCPVFVLVYVSILPALILSQQGRGWTVTWVSTGVLAVNLTLNWFAIPYGQAHLGPGGGGVAAATVWLVSETANVTIYFWLLRQRFFDSRNIAVFVKTAGTCVAVGTLHMLLPVSPLRLIADVLVYAAIVLAIRAIRIEEVTQAMRMAMSSRRGT